MNINEFRITYALPTYLCKVKRRIENMALRKKWSFYFIKGMHDGLFPWKNGKPEVSVF
jgi:hypothetical protein